MVRFPSTKAENLKHLLTVMPDDVWGKYLAQYLYMCVCMPACICHMCAGGHGGHQIPWMWSL